MSITTIICITIIHALLNNSNSNTNSNHTTNTNSY